MLTKDPQPIQSRIMNFADRYVTTIAAALDQQETNIWKIVADYLSSGQISQVRELADRWVIDHPGQPFVAEARLAEFSQDNSSRGKDPSITQLSSSLLTIVSISPVKNLDPAVQQVRESPQRLLHTFPFNLYAMENPNSLTDFPVDTTYSPDADQNIGLSL